MKIIFVYSMPHPMHKAWADLITKEQYPYINNAFFRKIGSRRPIIHQFFSILDSYRIPYSDIYFIENMTCLMPVIIRKRKNSKIIMINSDSFFDDLTRAKGIKKKAMLWYLKHIDGIISTSGLVNNFAGKFTNVPKVIVNPGIDKKFLKINADFNSNNIAHGLSGIRTAKGSDMVIDAFQKMKSDGKLYLIGPLEKNINLPNDKNIILTGWTDNPEKYLKKCSIFVNPARFEPFGMNIVEAMAAGFAPIVSENCGAKEVVSKVNPRLIIKPTIDEIIKAVNWLNEDDRKKILGKKAKEIAKEYTIDKSISQFKKEFKKLISKITKREK